MTNAGLSIILSVVETTSYCFALLNAQSPEDFDLVDFDLRSLAAIPLRGRLQQKDDDDNDLQSHMERFLFPPGPCSVPYEWSRYTHDLLIRSRPDRDVSSFVAWYDELTLPFQYGFLLVLGVPPKQRETIETCPPGLYDPFRGLILQSPSPSSWVLIKLGTGVDTIVLFLGLNCRHFGWPLSSCKLLPPRN